MRVVVVGGGWGGLSAAHALSKGGADVTLVDAAPRAGGLVGDGYLTPGGRRVEAGQHGFWNEYHNIFALLDELRAEGTIAADPLTGYAEQGQYSPRGLEAVWPVYREQKQRLPTGLGQALYTRFTNLPPAELATAAGLLLAFNEFDDSPAAWARFDGLSFKELCERCRVSERLYTEAFEPMILTGLFAPGEQCSAAAALGMAYFFVLKHQSSFDVRWCKGNVGEGIFEPWVRRMSERGVTFLPATRAVGFKPKGGGSTELCGVLTAPTGGGGGSAAAEPTLLEADAVMLAVGAAALSKIAPTVPGGHAEFARYTKLRGTSVLATRLYLDRRVHTPHTANACWGFDAGVGMTWFDISRLHELPPEEGSVIEVDYYSSDALLALDDEQIVAKAKEQLDAMLGASCAAAAVEDAAVVRLPSAVNWYEVGSYANMPDARSATVPNVYFAGDLVRTRHGSWSQEKACVTGVEAANLILGRSVSPCARRHPCLGCSAAPADWSTSPAAGSSAALVRARSLALLRCRSRIPALRSGARREMRSRSGKVCDHWANRSPTAALRATAVRTP